MNEESIFHISENGLIEVFNPRPSPSAFEEITGDVVFGILGRLLHNYLLPRDCPRVTYYATGKTTPGDKEKFLHSQAEFVVAIEAKWLPVIKESTLYCYELDNKSFLLLDECAGYYISYEAVKPVAKRPIDNLTDEIFKRNNVELRVLPCLWPLAEEVSKSTLNFSLIRMRNAIPKQHCITAIS